MRFLLDTNVVIGILKGDDSSLALRLRQRRPEDICLSAVVTHELYFGAYKSGRVEANLARLHALRFEVLPFDFEIQSSLAKFVQSCTPGASRSVLTIS